MGWGKMVCKFSRVVEHVLIYKNTSLYHTLNPTGSQAFWNKFLFWPYIGTLCVLALQTLHRWRLNFIVGILPWNRNVLIDKGCSTLTKMGKLVRSCKHRWVWQNGTTKPPTKILTKYPCGTFHLGVQKGMCILCRTERKPLGAIP